MRTKFFTGLVLLLCMFSAAFAQQKKAASGSTYAQVTKAYTQRILPQDKTDQILTDYDFIIRWNSTETPESFFWRSKDAWMSCRVLAYDNKKKKAAEEDISFDQIKKGTYLKIVGVRGGKFLIPEEIKTAPMPSLFFKTATSNWRYLTVKTFTKRKDKKAE